MTKRKRARKPREFKERGTISPHSWASIGGWKNGVFVTGGVIFPPDIRRLAAWLNKAADYLEQRGQR